MWVCDNDNCKDHGRRWTDQESPTGRCPTCGEQIASIEEWQDCRVFWGSHGCKLERGHEGPHLCECADPDEEGNVGGPPYYGPDTRFWGEDA